MVGTKTKTLQHADMAKLADAQRLGRCYRKVVLVQVQLSAQGKHDKESASTTLGLISLRRLSVKAYGGGNGNAPTIKGMTTREKKIQKGGWTKRAWREIRRKVLRVVLKEEANALSSTAEQAAYTR